MKKIVSICSGIVICLLVGAVSRLLHAEAMEVWYPTLEKSSLTPPDITFAIVWGVLYVLLGISAGLLYNDKYSISRKRLLWLFAIQLLLNICWNFSFFYLQNPSLGLVNLLVLDVLGLIFFTDTLRVKKSSVYLFLPYVIWLFFATYLNLYIFVNN